MYSESDREEVEDIISTQMEFMKILVNKAIESGGTSSIARLYRALYIDLRAEGFAPTECIELMKHRDLININKGD